MAELLILPSAAVGIERTLEDRTSKIEASAARRILLAIAAGMDYLQLRR
jgi:hypothetical protein